MTETKKNVETCDCEAIKNELEALKKEFEAVKAELEQAKQLNQQYEEGYKALQIRYNRLYDILGNQIEYSLGIK